MKHLIIGLGIVISGASVAHAQDLISEMQACRTKANNTARLACYDTLTLPSEKHHIPSQAGNSSPPAKPIADTASKTQSASSADSAASTVTRESQVKNFGLAKVIEPQDKVEKITSLVSAVQKNPYGKLIVTLESGQVWRQTNSTTLRLKPGQEVYVEEGALGSYFLGKESSNKRIRVKRSQ